MNDDPKDTALRMLRMYGHSIYTPQQRATDYAFLYDSQDAGRKFWLAVIDYMNARKETA